MITNKYAKDYRLENEVNAKGKTVTKAVYTGRYYVFEKTKEEVKAASKALAVSAAGAAAMLLIGMIFYNNKGFASQYYTSAPFLICFLPLLYLCMGVYSVFAVKDRCTRERKDHSGERVTKSAFAGMILSGADIIGIVIASILKAAGVETRPVTLNDVIFIIASVFLFAFFFLAFTRRGSVVMNEERTGD